MFQVFYQSVHGLANTACVVSIFLILLFTAEPLADLYIFGTQTNCVYRNYHGLHKLRAREPEVFSEYC
jgi:hypothetical protein